MASTNVQSYMKNLGKSILFSSVKAVGNQMPMLSKTYDANKYTLSSGMQYTKSFLQTPGSAFEVIENMAKKYIKDIEDIKNNAFSDLQSGKFVNFDRQANDHMDENGFGSDFDLSWGDDEDIDVEMSFGDSVKVATKVTEEGNNMRTKAIMSTISKSSEESTNFLANSNKKLQFLSMNMQSKMHTETMKMMSDSTMLLTNMVEFQNNQMTDHMNKQLAFYDNVLSELREIKENQKTAMSTPNNNGKRTDRNNVLGMYGEVNLSEYGKQIKKNAKNWIDSTPIGLMLSMQSMANSMGPGIMEQIKANPLSFAMDFMMTRFMPKSVKTTLGGLDNSFSGLFSTLALKLNAVKKDMAASPVKSFLATILGIDLPSDKKINVGGYHKEAMSYNGRADKAITEVIPTLLSHILSAVKGSDKIALYDYKTGKFTDAKGILKENTKDIKNSKMSEMSDIRRQLEGKLSKVPGGNSKFMNNELSTFLYHLIESEDIFNPLKQTSKPKGMKLQGKNSYNTIRAAFLSLPKGEQNRLANYIINARQSGVNKVESIQDDLFETGLSAAYSGLNDIHGINSDSSNKKGKNRKTILSRKLFSGKSTSLGNLVNNGTHPFNSVSLPVETMVTMMQAFDSVDDQTKGILDNKYIKKLIGDNPETKEAISKFQKLKKRLSPANMINNFVGKIDSMIYRVIYGKDSTDDEGNPKPDATGKIKPNSFIGRMSMGISKGIDSSITSLNSKLIDPLADKIFGEEGLMTKFATLFEPFLKKMKEFAKVGWYKVKDFMYGSKNAEGFYTGGLFSDIGNSGLDFNNSIRHFFSGSPYVDSKGNKIEANKDTSVFAYIKNYSKDIMGFVADGLLGDKQTITDPKTGEVTVKRTGKGLFTPVVDELKSFTSYIKSIFNSNDKSDDINKTSIQWRKEIKSNLPKATAGGLLGLMSSVILPFDPMGLAVIGSSIAFANSSDKFKNMLFGEEGKGGILPDWQKNVITKVKGNLKGITAGGIMGLGASLLLPLPVPALVTIGSALGYAKSSDTSKEFLFGKTDKDGNIIKKGFLPNSIIESVKKFYPKTVAGAIIGGALGIGLPGISMVPMMFMGSAVGFASQSDKVKEFLFGKVDSDGNVTKRGLLPRKILDNINKLIPAGIKGAVIGGIGGLMGGPFGLLGGMVLGSGFGMLMTSDKFRESILGKKGEDGKRKGGLVGLLKTGFDKVLIRPLKSLGNWLLDFKRTKREGGLIPFVFKGLWDIFGTVLSPLGKTIKGAFQLVFNGKKGGFVSTFTKEFAKSMAHGILGPLKGLGTIANLAFKGLFGSSKVLGRFLFGYKVDKNGKAPEEESNLGLLGRYFKGIFGQTEPYKRAQRIKTGGPNKLNSSSDLSSRDKSRQQVSQQAKQSKLNTGTKWGRIGQLARTAGLASQTMSVEARLNNLTRIVSTVKTDEQYKHAQLALLHDIAVSTATGVSSNKKENNIPNLLSMLPGLFSGLGLAMAALGTNLVNIITGQDYSGTGMIRAITKILEKFDPSKKNKKLRSKMVKETAGEIIEKGTKAETSGGSATTARIGQKLAETKLGKNVTATAKNISDKIIKLLKNTSVLKAFGSSASTIKKYAPRIAETISRLVMKSAPKAAGRILGALGGPIAQAIFGVYDIVSGSTFDAKYIAQVPPGTEITLGMRVTAGLSKFLSGMVLGLISELTIFNIIYPIIGKDKNVSEWKDNQSKLKSSYDEYRLQNVGKDMTFDQYNRSVNPTTFDTAKSLFKTSNHNKTITAPHAVPLDQYKYKQSGHGVPGIQRGLPAAKPDGIGGGNPEFYDKFTSNPRSLINQSIQKDIKTTTTRLQGPNLNKSIQTFGGVKSKQPLGGKTDDQLRKEYSYVFKYTAGDMTVQDLRMIEERCASYGISPHLWLAVVEKESGYNSRAKNSSGTASGWGQLIKSTAEGLYKRIFRRNDYNHNTMGFDKQVNSELSIYYLSSQVKKLGIRNGIAGYNQGGGNYFNSAGQKYAEDVLKRIKRNTKIDPNYMVFQGNGKPFQYDPSLSSGLAGIPSSGLAGMSSSGNGTSFFSLMTNFGTALTSATSTLLGGFDISKLSSVFSNYANYADPFYSPGDPNSGSNGDYGQLSYQLSGADAEKSKQLKELYKTKYPRLTGDADTHSFLAARLNKLGNDLGVDVKINSGYRTAAEQQGLIDDWRRNNPGKSEKERRKWVADPGKGTHEVGLAADIGTKKIQNMSNLQLSKYGLYKPMSYEKWHVEPIETQGIIRNNSVAQLTPLYGTPYNPADYKQYLSPLYKDIGGGDPSYYDNSPNIDKTIKQLSDTTNADKYVQRVDGMKTLAKATEAHDNVMNEYLKVIADGIMQLVGIATDTKAVLETIAKKSVDVITSVPKTQPIVIPTPQSNNQSANSSNKKIDKGLAISSIAKGTM